MATLNGLPVFKIKVDESLESNQGIDFISLVDYPAIESNWVALSKDAKFAFNADKQLLYGAILIPDQPIYRFSKEMGEFYVVFTKEEILKLVRKFQAQQKTINLNYQHKEGTQIANAVIQEIWIVENPDKSQKYVKNLPEGSAFVVAHIGDSKFWNEEVKSGNVKGFSIEGFLDMELNKIKNKMENQKFAEAITSSGTLKTDAESFAPGVACTLVGSDNTEQKAPAGEYMLENGSKIVIDEMGNVVEVVEAPEVEDASLNSEEIAVVQSAVKPLIAEMSKQIEDLKTQLDELKHKYSNMPAAQPLTKKDEPKSVPTKMEQVYKLKSMLNKKVK